MSVAAVVVDTVILYDPRLLLGPFAGAYSTILPVGLAVVNVVLLVRFVLSTVRRLLGRPRGLPPSAHVDIGLDPVNIDPHAITNDTPSLLETLTGDLLFGATLAISLFFAYSRPLLPVLARTVFKSEVERCDV